MVRRQPQCSVSAANRWTHLNINLSHVTLTKSSTFSFFYKIQSLVGGICVCPLKCVCDAEEPVSVHDVPALRSHQSWRVGDKGNLHPTQEEAGLTSRWNKVSQAAAVHVPQKSGLCRRIKLNQVLVASKDSGIGWLLWLHVNHNVLCSIFCIQSLQQKSICLYIIDITKVATTRKHQIGREKHPGSGKDLLVLTLLDLLIFMCVCGG